MKTIVIDLNYNYYRDGCVAVYKLNDNDHKPNFLIHIKDCHKEGLEEVSAVEKVGNTIVTVSNKSDSICFWQLGNNESDVQHTMPCNISSKYDIFEL